MDVSNRYTYNCWHERTEPSGRRVPKELVPEPWAGIPSPTKPASQPWYCRPGASTGTVFFVSQRVSFLGFSPYDVVWKGCMKSNMKSNFQELT